MVSSWGKRDQCSNPDGTGDCWRDAWADWTLEWSWSLVSTNWVHKEKRQVPGETGLIRESNLEQGCSQKDKPHWWGWLRCGHQKSLEIGWGALVSFWRLNSQLNPLCLIFLNEIYTVYKIYLYHSRNNTKVETNGHKIWLQKGRSAEVLRPLSSPPQLLFP